MPAGLCPAAPLVDTAAWLRYGATLLTFCRFATLARHPARLQLRILLPLLPLLLPLLPLLLPLLPRSDPGP